MSSHAENRPGRTLDGITRRQVLAGGATAFATGMLLGPSALSARGNTPAWTPHTVTPATTSWLAVIGAFSSGPVDEASLVTSWDEFVSLYGGLVSANSPPSMAVYAVWQFFQNGGEAAFIVRLTAPDSALAETVALGPLTLRANSPGAWANDLRVEIRASAGAQQLDGAPSGTPDHVDLVVSNANAPLETLPQLPNGPGGTQVAALISATSALLTATAQGTETLSPGSQTLQGGSDGTWSPRSFTSAVLAQVAEPDISPAPEPVLDHIAPSVFNLLSIPDAVYLSSAAQAGVIDAAHRFCKARHAFLIADPPPPSAALAHAWLPGAAATPVDNVGTPAGLTTLTTWAKPVLTADHDSGAVYYPWVSIDDPAGGPAPILVPPSGTVAGVYATTDTARGVWKAPAGVEATLAGIVGLADGGVDDDTVNGELNPIGINCLRSFPGTGTVVWGARTLAGNELFESPWKYLSTVRLAEFVQQSLDQSLKWAIFEPNDATLWGRLALETTTFMNWLAGAGAFDAATGYHVACDATTTSPADVQNGIVNLAVAFQPAAPAEFVVLTIVVASAAGAI